MEQTRIDTDPRKSALRHHEEARAVEWFWTLTLLVVSVTGLAVYFFGIPGLVAIALLLLPGIFAVLMLLTMGR